MRSPFFWPEFESGPIKRVSIQTTPAPLLGLQHAANVPGLAQTLLWRKIELLLFICLFSGKMTGRANCRSAAAEKERREVGAATFGQETVTQFHLICLRRAQLLNLLNHFCRNILIGTETDSV